MTERHQAGPDPPLSLRVGFQIWPHDTYEDLVHVAVRSTSDGLYPACYPDSLVETHWVSTPASKHFCTDCFLAHQRELFRRFWVFTSVGDPVR